MYDSIQSLEQPTSKSGEINEIGVSIIVPAYNEEGGIGDVLSYIKEVMDHSSFPYELVVVNDGSTDNTEAIIREYEGIHALQHRHNRGYGASLKTGIRHAKYELIVITDADGTYPNDMIPAMIQQLVSNDYDMVVGARIGDSVSIPLIRRPAKWFIRQLAATVAGQPIPDINSGLRVFRRRVALRFFNLLPDGFSFTTTITLGMLTNGYYVDYLPINYHARVGASKIKPIRDTLNFVQLILRMALYFSPLKIFLPLSFILIFIAVLWGVFSIVALGAFADNSTFLLALTALQVGLLGLLAELINRRVPSEFRDGDELD